VKQFPVLKPVYRLQNSFSLWRTLSQTADLWTPLGASVL